MRSLLLVFSAFTLLGLSSTAYADPYGDTILADNPLAYWRFSETSGTTAANEVSAQDGTLILNANPNTPGPLPPAFVGFDGANSATNFGGAANNSAINTPVSMSNLGAFTIEAWVRPTGAQANRTGLVGQNDAIEFGWINNNTIQIWTPGGGSLNVGQQADAAGFVNEWPSHSRSWHRGRT